MSNKPSKKRGLIVIKRVVCVEQNFTNKNDSRFIFKVIPVVVCICNHDDQVTAQISGIVLRQLHILPSSTVIIC